MSNFLTTHVLILGVIDSVLDLLKIHEERMETKDALFSTILSRFFTALLGNSSFAVHMQEIAPRLKGNTDPEAVLKAIDEQLMEKGASGLDVVPIFKAQAKAVLSDFVQAAETDVPREDLLALVDASFQS